MKISNLLLKAFLFVSILLSFIFNKRNEELAQYASMYFNEDNLMIVHNRFDKNAAARIKYIPSLEEIGWDKLHIITNSTYPESQQAYAAGYLEGVLTSKRIYNHWRNLNTKTWRGKGLPDNVKEYLNANDEYLKEQINKNPNDEYWNQVNNIREQFKGLVAGYNSANPPVPLDILDFHTMSSFGDLFEIVYYQKEPPKFDTFTTEEMKKFIWTNTHCSALFKVKEDYSDLWFGHNSWFYYIATNRIMKEYTFNFKNVKSNTIAFSSYPATLASIDDFYVTSSDLVIIETTNPFFNQKLYQNLTPRSILCWERTMIANRLSDSSEKWVEYFIKENSGTYNNQFMALDLKLIKTEERRIEDKAMFIVEQLPGDYEISDVTDYLRYGYWPSYNVPFSKRIRSVSLFDEQIAKHPDLKDSIDYNVCARANIFRRDQGKITTLKEFQELLRYNNYQTDPLSKKNPGYAISSRYDLLEKAGDHYCMGAYDGKAASIHDVKGKKIKSIQVIAGPTSQGQKPFEWKSSNFCQNEIRLGLPEKYNFDWFTFQTTEGIEADNMIESSLNFLE